MTCILCDNGEQALCDARRGKTALDLHGTAQKDSQGVWRCLVCLRTVNEHRFAWRHPGGMISRIIITLILTGYEPLCCGGEGEPLSFGGEE